MVWLLEKKQRIDNQTIYSQHLFQNTIYKFLSRLCWHKYLRQNIEGWNVLINRELLIADPEIAREAIDLLALRLQEIKETIPAKHHPSLMQTKIWLEKSTAGFPGMVYHISAKWLQNNGYNPKKAHAIEICNVQNFIKWDSTQPWHVLHELAHAYHHQVITYEFEPLIKAHQHAQELGLHQNVLRNNGKMTTSYALKNVKEYFAELSEAYFGENDFFPFTREQLKEYDSQGYLAVEAAWDIENG